MGIAAVGRDCTCSFDPTNSSARPSCVHASTASSLHCRLLNRTGSDGPTAWRLSDSACSTSCRRPAAPCITALVAVEIAPSIASSAWWIAPTMVAMKPFESAACSLDDADDASGDEDDGRQAGGQGPGTNAPARSAPSGIGAIPVNGAKRGRRGGRGGRGLQRQRVGGGSFPPPLPAVFVWIQRAGG